MDTKKIGRSSENDHRTVKKENREGLQETPTRIAKMYQEIFAGLGRQQKSTCLNHLKSLITIWWSRRISSSIPCEHHFLPFYGKVHIAYIPNGGPNWPVRRGLLKPQIQERLTVEIADAL